MEKRLIAAIALSIFVIMAFQFLSPKKVQETPANNVSIAEDIGVVETVKEEPTQVVVDGKETSIETDRYILTFSNVGGAIKAIRIKEYKEAKTDEPLILVLDAEGENAVCSLESNSLVSSLGRRKFTLKNRTPNSLDYVYTVPGKFELTKKYYFRNTLDYIELRISIKNIGSDAIYKYYDLIGGSSLRSTKMAMGRRFSEIDSMIDGKLVRNNKIKNGEMFTKGIISWTGVKERYFSIILKPKQESEGVILKQFGPMDFASGIRSAKAPIYAGATTEDSYILYIGPNDLTRLKNTGLGLEPMINYGIFGGITKVLLAVLRGFHKVVRNWGVAIIMLTFLINICLFPLTKKSFTSMRQLQQLQPHMEKLRSVHKDNPQKLNREMAELYKTYKVNPLGGCLPMFIQMPIFIALYQGLIRSIELKGANFLWVKDLSSPDYITLPLTLPFIGNQIHILPLLMVGAMFFQQKMSSKSMASSSPEQKQQQKIMLIFFPLFFGFLFYNFPSGLVLYWLTNTVLMVTEHSMMRKTPTIQ